jgi:hypothetical protein
MRKTMPAYAPSANQQPRHLMMLPLANFLPRLPGLTALAGSLKTYAPSPVWRDSTTKDVKFQPLPKKLAVKLWHRARDFERRTRQPGKQDGALGRNGLAVLQSLIFDFLDFRTGQLDPAQKTIAANAGISPRSVARGLVSLKLSGVLNWLRRCTESFKDGRFTLEQETNAYAILPSSQWLGYVEPPEAPPPQPGTWGDHPCGMRDPLTEADIEQGYGKDAEAVIRQLELGECGSAAAQLASLGRAMYGAKP